LLLSRFRDKAGEGKEGTALVAISGFVEVATIVAALAIAVAVATRAGGGAPKGWRLPV
jgi:hypothetical protein